MRRGQRVTRTQAHQPAALGQPGELPFARCVALVLQQEGQVVQADGGVRVVRTQVLLADGQGALEEGTDRGVVALDPQQARLFRSRTAQPPTPRGHG